MASALLVLGYCRTYFVNPLLRFGCTVMPARFHPAATKISTTIWMARWMISLLLEESGARASFAKTAHTGCNKAVFKSANLWGHFICTFIANWRIALDDYRKNPIALHECAWIATSVIHNKCESLGPFTQRRRRSQRICDLFNIWGCKNTVV